MFSSTNRIAQKGSIFGVSCFDFITDSIVSKENQNQPFLAGLMPL
jgi:hypothetical protein